MERNGWVILRLMTFNYGQASYILSTNNSTGSTTYAETPAAMPAIPISASRRSIRSARSGKGRGLKYQLLVHSVREPHCPDEVVRIPELTVQIHTSGVLILPYPEPREQRPRTDVLMVCVVELDGPLLTQSLLLR